MNRRLIAIMLLTMIGNASAQMAWISNKPAVSLLATGGTIAGSAASNTDLTGYTAGTVGVDQLVAAVPELMNIAQIDSEQISNVDSNEVDTKLLLNLVERIKAQLPTRQGIVITHGTDTLEETAFFLDLTLKTEKPVVLVGAMRPATAISADGPLNLLEAVAVAADPTAKHRGVLVVLNDRIGSGFYITKTHSSTVDTFKSPEQGYLGMFVNKKPLFYYTPAQPTNKPYFDISRYKSLPKVSILYGYQGFDIAMLDATVRNGAKGIVIAATGDGSISANVKAKVEKLMKKGVPVILSSRTASGFVSVKEVGIGSGRYNPQKAKILLSLALAEKANLEQISRYFAQ